MEEIMTLRIQYTRGYKLNRNAIRVGANTSFANPYDTPAQYEAWLNGELKTTGTLEARRRWILAHLHLLYDKNLVCECDLDSPCHADVLLRMAH
jgi:hypothetical protein